MYSLTQTGKSKKDADVDTAVVGQNEVAFEDDAMNEDVVDGGAAGAGRAGAADVAIARGDTDIAGDIDAEGETVSDPDQRPHHQ